MQNLYQSKITIIFLAYLVMVADYSGQNLRGRSFKGQNLEGANFSGADIRSADFSGAILKGANFSSTTAGLQFHWIIAWIVGLFFLTGLSGFVSLIAGVFATTLLREDNIKTYTVIPGVIVLVTLFIVLIITLRKGFAASSIVVGTVAIAIAGIGFWSEAYRGASVLTAMFLAESGGGFLVTLAAIAIAVAGSNAVIDSLAWYTTGSGVAFGIVAAALIGILLKVKYTIGNIIWASIVVLLGGYIGWQALTDKQKFRWVKEVVVFIGATGGTTFKSANLADANFTSATLKNTDFRDAILRRTSWFQAKQLNLSRVGEGYLKNPQVRQLVVTKQGQNNNFDGLPLQCINLQGANLADASFIGANLNEGNLQDADLSRAKLKQTQLDGTDFTGAILTGTYIEDWGITNDTKFNEVRCEYVYMRVPTKENPDPLRKPDNNKEVFANGEFDDFIKPIFDTLDLYHNQGIDPRAITISFKQLAENHLDAELRIVGMEIRGENKFLIRAKTASQANKSILSAEYFHTYNQLKGLPPQELRLLLQEQGSRIRNLENMITTALYSPQFHEVKTILILAANPKNTSSLRLDEEVREIDAGLQRAKKREQFDLKQRWAIRVRDVSQALLDFEPHIVHFSGHGSGEDGLVLEDETGNVRLVETVALAKLFKLFAPHIECVILNACYSEVQAEAVVQHIPYVIGMNKDINDKASIEFAVGFYAALGAGKSIEFAHEFGCNAIQLVGFPEYLTPVLKKKQ